MKKGSITEAKNMRGAPIEGLTFNQLLAAGFNGRLYIRDFEAAARRLTVNWS
jgi:hypothetical protein